MKPIEAMAKAAFESIWLKKWVNPENPNDPDDDDREGWIQGMRAALLALAEAELPEEIEAVNFLHGFRPMLRAIANQS